MTKDEIIMDWLDSKENRSQLTKLEVGKPAYDVFNVFGDVYRTKDGEIVYGIGNHLYILIVEESDAEIMK